MLLETQALLKRLRSKTRTLDIKTEVDYEFHEKSFIISRKQLLIRTLDTKKGLRLHRPQRLSIPRPSSIQGENAEIHQQFISNKEQNCKQRQLLKSLSLQQQELSRLEGHHKCKTCRSCRAKASTFREHLPLLEGVPVALLLVTNIINVIQ